MVGATMTNSRELAAILGDTTVLVSTSWREEPTGDLRLGMVSYETDKQQLPIRGSEMSSRYTISERALVSVTSQRGRGPALDLVMHALERSAKRVFELRALYRLLKNADMALFALDHDGGHGTSVSAGVRELWAASGPDTWAAYAKKREELMAWIEVMMNEAP